MPLHLPRSRTDAKNEAIRRCAIAALVALLAVSVQAAGAVDVTGAAKITSPGTYYLRNNITSSPASACINISSSDVYFDGMGYILDGVDAHGTNGVYVHAIGSTLSNVTVRNVTVRDWNTGIFYYGVENSTIGESTVLSNRQNGITFQLAGNTTVRSASALENGVRGINLEFTSRTNISGAVISKNPTGLRLSLSNFNWIVGSSFEDNDIDMVVSSSGSNTIWNNAFNGTDHLDIDGASINTWNVSKQPGTSMRNGPTLGGNFWANGFETGFSFTTPDDDGDGICDLPYTAAAGAVDQLPLAAAVGQHEPIFGSDMPFRFLRSDDGYPTTVPTDLYYVYDGSSPDGREGSPDIMRFAVTMADAGLMVTANVSAVDGTLVPIQPVSVAGNVYTFAHPIGDTSLGDTSSSLRRIAITASIAGFSNTSDAVGGNPAPLTAVVNAHIMKDWPNLTGTDWRDVTDFTSIENLTFGAPGIGSVRYLQPLNLCNATFADALGTLTGALRIEEGGIALDSDRPGMAVLNQPAMLAMILPHASCPPGLFADGLPAAYANGTIPAGSPVTSVAWDEPASELIVTVGYWANYTADDTGPDLAIAAPANGSIVDTATVTVQGTASDASGVALVEARINDGAWLAADGTEIWSVLLDVPAGHSTITVRATDGIGCTAVEAVNVTRPGPPTTAPTPVAGSSHSRGGGEPAVTEFVGIGRLTVSSFGVLLRDATIRSEDGRVVLYLAAGTRILDTTRGHIDEISLRPMQPEELPESLSSLRVSDGYILEPEGAAFDPPLTARYAIRNYSMTRTGKEVIRCFVSNGSSDAWDELPVSSSGSAAFLAIDRASAMAIVTALQESDEAKPALSTLQTESLPRPAVAPEHPTALSASPFVAAVALILASVGTACYHRKRR